MVILADLAAPGHCLAAAGLRVGIGMATRHPGVWRWRVGPCDRAQEINATTCHTGYRQSLGDGLLLLLHQRSVDFLSGDDGPVRLIGKGGVEGLSRFNEQVIRKLLLARVESIVAVDEDVGVDQATRHADAPGARRRAHCDGGADSPFYQRLRSAHEGIVAQLDPLKQAVLPQLLPLARSPCPRTGLGSTSRHTSSREASRST